MNAPRILRSSLLALALAALTAVAAVATVAPAWAQGDPRVEARTHYMAGKQKFDAGDFRGAIGEFTAADQLAPSPMNDYNVALAYERLNEPASAVRYYRSYLNRMPTASNRAEVEAALARLDAAAKADADRLAAEQARQAEEARLAEAARQAEAARLAEEARLAGAGGGGAPAGGGAVPAGPTTYPPTGDAELDRVAAVDLAAMRGAAPLPPASASGGGAGAAGGGAAPPVGGNDAPPPKKAKPFYKSPVFWVVAAVGVYVLIVLSNDNSNSTQTGLMVPLPDGPASGNGPAGNGGVLLRF